MKLLEYLTIEGDLLLVKTNKSLEEVFEELEAVGENPISHAEQDMIILDERDPDYIFIS